MAGRSVSMFIIVLVVATALRLTPARTLVISSTRIPANGNVDVFGAAVARPRLLPVLQASKRIEGRQRRAKYLSSLGAAM